MAEILSRQYQYQSVFSLPRPATQILPQASRGSVPPIMDVLISAESIKEAIKSIDSTSASGPDGITPQILKDYSDELVDPLSLLYRWSINTGSQLDNINLAYIAPVFKSGTKSEPANYRPVALTNHITKILERLIKTTIVNHLIEHQLYNESQHGFRPQRSTTTNLLEYYESILLQLQFNRAVDSIYLDFSKAFDKCDHNIILRKLSTLGIQGELHHWIEGFLRKRKQCVVVKGHKSSEVWATSGVPQGSVIGPVLFLVLMYDISLGINEAILSSFADDTKVWRGVSNLEDEATLQNDLDAIYSWAMENNMVFNSDKFQAIRFHEATSIHLYRSTDGTHIKQQQIVKDLGLHISDDLSFDHHIEIVIKRGNQMAGWILRVFRGRSRNLLLPLLKRLIIPRVEYCSIIWSPRSRVLCSRIESVQKNFTSKIDFGERRPDYWERLSELKLYSLERRRERYMVIYVWKVIHALYPNPGIGLNKEFMAQHRLHPNSGIGYISFNDRLGYEVGHPTGNVPTLDRLSILTRWCEIFNEIPHQLRRTLGDNEAPSLTKFKKALDSWLEQVPDQPTIPGRWRAAISNSIVHQRHYVQHQ